MPAPQPSRPASLLRATLPAISAVTLMLIVAACSTNKNTAARDRHSLNPPESQPTAGGGDAPPAKAAGAQRGEDLTQSPATAGGEKLKQTSSAPEAVWATRGGVPAQTIATGDQPVSSATGTGAPPPPGAPPSPAPELKPTGTEGFNRSSDVEDKLRLRDSNRFGLTPDPDAVSGTININTADRSILRLLTVAEGENTLDALTDLSGKASPPQATPGDWEYALGRIQLPGQGSNRSNQQRISIEPAEALGDASQEATPPDAGPRPNLSESLRDDIAKDVRLYKEQELVYRSKGDPSRTETGKADSLDARYRAIQDKKNQFAALSAVSAASAMQVRRLTEFPGSLPALDEEIWVIQKAPRSAGAPDGERPGTGSLIISDIEGWGESSVPVPLKHTDVHATITGNIASVNVTQQFANPFSGKIEAVYVFPLPENAAVNEFVMTIGDRHIRGIIRDREEAQQIYAAARSQGRVAALLEQERPNIFTQKVANIEPGKSLEIAITYFNTLPYIDGEFEFTLPMVVGPRFNPAGTYEGVGAVSREAAANGNTSGQPVEVAYLKPTERSGQDIAITVDINAGMPLGRVYSDSHVIDTTMAVNPGAATRATLSKRDSVPNKDFVLRYRVASEGADTRSGIITYTDKDGTGYFSALVIPPASAEKLARSPVELVFVLDCSGSMQGRPIEQAVAAVTRGLKRLGPDDTFQIINFANTSSQLGAAPIPATDANIAAGLQYTQSLFAQGGTYMVNGLRASLDFPHDPERLRYVCFLTDGYIGNEAEIIGEIQARLGPSRIFSFGVGSSVNRYLIDAMAKVGRGCVAHVAAGDSPDQIMDRFFDRISRPAMTDLTLDLGDLAGSVEQVFPRSLPDLLPGRAVVINGKLKPGASLTSTVLKVRGRQAGREQSIEIPLTMNGIVPPATNAALPQIWARHKLADLSDFAIAASVTESASQIKDVALRYNLMSAFTSFVAVDTASQTAGSSGTTVTQPVPMPEGVNYEANVINAR